MKEHKYKVKDNVKEVPENCPICNDPENSRCRCMIGDRTCTNWHHWYLCPEHNRLFYTDDRTVKTHFGKHWSDSRCTCMDGGPKTAGVLQVLDILGDDEISSYTEEMEKAFIDRTNEHIHRVANNLNKFIGYPGISTEELKNRAENHDRSKIISIEEHDPYVWVNWKHRCKRLKEPFKVSENIEKRMDDATRHHILNNSHHPEYHLKDPSILNNFSRDTAKEHKESTLVIPQMPLIDIIELVSDWLGMDQEFGGNSAKNWADKNIDVRWKFTEDNKKQIYDAISHLDNLRIASKVMLRLKNEL